MIKNVLTHIGGIEIYGILSLLIFFAFFLGMLVWVFRLKRGHLDDMGRLPLEGDPTEAELFRESHTQPDTSHE